METKKEVQKQENKPQMVVDAKRDLKQVMFSPKNKRAFLSQIAMPEEQANTVFNREASFAIQLIKNIKNPDFMLNTINQNPESLMFAIANVAASGLTLNPDLKLAYLVPRDGRVMFQSSYMGKKELIMQSGIVSTLYAKVVRGNDIFEVEEGTRPGILHRPNYKSDRGAVVGAYAVAIYPNGVAEFEVLTLSEILAIKAKSPANSTAFSPWNTGENDFVEMCKKTVINRIFKGLAKMKASKELLHLLQTENEIEATTITESKGFDFEI